MKHRDQAGFSALHILIVIVVAGVLGFVGWRVASMQSDTTQTSTAAVQTGDGMQKYTNTAVGYNFMHPADWNIKKEDTKQNDISYNTVTLTSPGGTVVTFEADPGGRGGDCQPEPTDVPFKVTNTCATVEYLSKQPVADIRDVYDYDYSTVDRKLAKAEVSVITKHFSAPDPESTDTYTIGLENTADYSFSGLNAPAMGFVGDISVMTPYKQDGTDYFGSKYTNISIYSIGKSKSFLTSNDGTMVKQILASVRFTK